MSLWNPEPGWQEEVEKFFAKVKIDPTVKITDEEVEKSLLKKMGKRLEPFRTKVRAETMWRLLD